MNIRLLMFTPGKRYFHQGQFTDLTNVFNHTPGIHEESDPLDTQGLDN